MRHPTQHEGTIYGIRLNRDSGEVAVKIGRKVVRFPTDERDWKIGEPVIVMVMRPADIRISDDVLIPTLPNLEELN